MWTLFSQSRSKYKVCKKSAVWEKRMNKVIMQKVTAKNIFKQKVQLDIMPTVLLWLALLGEKKKNCVSVNSSLSCSKCILFCFFCWVLLVKKKKKKQKTAEAPMEMLVFLWWMAFCENHTCACSWKNQAGKDKCVGCCFEVTFSSALPPPTFFFVPVVCLNVLSAPNKIKVQKV